MGFQGGDRIARKGGLIAAGVDGKANWLLVSAYR